MLLNCVNEKCQLNHLPLSLIVICLGGANLLFADRWAAPTIQEYYSANGKYVVITKPGSRGQSPNATVYQIEKDNRILHWQSNLTNTRGPVKAFVSNDGEYVITLDNWSRVGYGEDVIAFYNSDGQIKRYSLEEATLDFFIGIEKPRFISYFSRTASSRWWRDNSITLINKTGKSACFGIWLDWARRWFVWRIHDGMPIKLEPCEKMEWDAMGREWAKRHIKEDKSMTSCFLFLGYLKDPRDRVFIEQQLASKDFKKSRGGSLSSPIRRAADLSLAFWDGLFDNINNSKKILNNEYFFLGNVNFSVQLPHGAKTGDGQVVVVIYSEDKSPEKWETSKTDYKLIKSFMYQGGEGRVHKEIIFQLYGITPGRYWVKVLWDKMPPFKYNLWKKDDTKAWQAIDLPDISLESGDYESKAVEYFEIKAGLTTEVTIWFMTP